MSVTIDSPLSDPTVVKPIPVTVTFGEAVSGFDVSDVITSDGDIKNFAGSGADFSFDVAPFAPGLVEIEIPLAAATGTMSMDDTAAATFAIELVASRPDLRVGGAGNPASHRGNNSYRRTRHVESGIKKRTRFFFSLENDSSAADRFAARATNRNQFRSVYRSGGRNITGALIRGRFQVSLAPNDVRNVMAIVSTKRNRPVPQVYRSAIIARSIHGGAADSLQVVLRYLPTRGLVRSIKPPNLNR